jgi:hypothetical protein
MGQRPWRISLGIAVVLLWTGVIGFPVLVFHSASVGLQFGEHLHAAILFIASQVLVFWLAARTTRFAPRPRSERRVTPASTPQLVWNAELVEPEAESRLAADTESASDQLPAPLTIGNYLASSQVRLVMVEPGGFRQSLLPGQSLNVFVQDAAGPVRYRIVESDSATQVFVEGGRVAEVVVCPSGAADYSERRSTV